MLTEVKNKGNKPQKKKIKTTNYVSNRGFKVPLVTEEALFVRALFTPDGFITSQDAAALLDRATL